MNIEGKKLLQRLSAEKGDRGKVTLYLSKKLYSNFKSSCGAVSASLVIEELMREFVESLQKTKK